MNSINMIGRLVSDPTLRYTQSGKAIANITIAVNRKFKKDEADFFECTAWEKTAEIMAEYLRKGDQVGISGTLRKESYEKDGQKRYKTYIIVDSFDFIGSKNQKTEQINTSVVEDVLMTDEFPF